MKDFDIIVDLMNSSLQLVIDCQMGEKKVGGKVGNKAMSGILKVEAIFLNRLIFFVNSLIKGLTPNLDNNHRVRLCISNEEMPKNLHNIPVNLLVNIAKRLAFHKDFSVEGLQRLIIALLNLGMTAYTPPVWTNMATLARYVFDKTNTLENSPEIIDGLLCFLQSANQFGDIEAAFSASRYLSEIISEKNIKLSEEQQDKAHLVFNEIWNHIKSMGESLTTENIIDDSAAKLGFIDEFINSVQTICGVSGKQGIPPTNSWKGDLNNWRKQTLESLQGRKNKRDEEELSKHKKALATFFKLIESEQRLNDLINKKNKLMINKQPPTKWCILKKKTTDEKALLSSVPEPVRSNPHRDGCTIQTDFQKNYNQAVVFFNNKDMENALLFYNRSLQCNLITPEEKVYAHAGMADAEFSGLYNKKKEVEGWVKQAESMESIYKKAHKEDKHPKNFDVKILNKLGKNTCTVFNWLEPTLEKVLSHQTKALDSCQTSKKMNFNIFRDIIKEEAQSTTELLYLIRHAINKFLSVLKLREALIIKLESVDPNKTVVSEETKVRNMLLRHQRQFLRTDSKTPMAPVLKFPSREELDRSLSHLDDIVVQLSKLVSDPPTGATSAKVQPSALAGTDKRTCSLPSSLPIQLSDYREVLIPGDGNCFYGALVEGLNRLGISLTVDQLRLELHNTLQHIVHLIQGHPETDLLRRQLELALGMPSTQISGLLSDNIIRDNARNAQGNEEFVRQYGESSFLMIMALIYPHTYVIRTETGHEELYNQDVFADLYPQLFTFLSGNILALDIPPASATLPFFLTHSQGAGPASCHFGLMVSRQLDNSVQWPQSEINRGVLPAATGLLQEFLLMPKPDDSVHSFFH